jgi:prevent-host-death family protein
MVSRANTHSLTDFRHNAKRFIDELRETKTPLVLTINGRAAVVALDVSSFENYQSRIRELEEEVQSLKLASLKGSLMQGGKQAEQGQFSKRTFDGIIAAAHAAIGKDPLV